jgi:DNA uptake protein ComE-like DNA-binding protein
MWKDFFYFSKGERHAIIVLTILIVIFQIALWTVDSWLPLLPESLTNASVDQKALNIFKDSLIIENSYKKSRNDFYKNYSRKYSPLTKSPILSAFDPNTADSIKLVSLGLRPYVAKNILKYRRKGGAFRNAEDFSRIYGIEPTQYETLKPFIRIKSGTAEETISQKSEVLAANQITKPEELIPVSSQKIQAQVQALEINKVDTAVLQQLKGVGTFSANRIIQYRSRLGGFYSINQLEEVKGLYPEVLMRLQSFLKVDTAHIVRINANKASLERLKSHPYISFYQAKVIVELRKARSGIKNINELADFKEFTMKDINRLKWYLSF